MPTTTAPATPDAVIRAWVLDLPTDAGLTLLEVRERIEQIVAEHPGVGTVKVTPRGKNGAAKIVAFGPDGEPLSGNRHQGRRRDRSVARRGHADGVSDAHREEARGRRAPGEG
jgi:hypothetical protein